MRRIAHLLVTAAILTGCSNSNSVTTPTCTISAVAVSGAPATLNVGANVTLTATLTQQNCTNPTVTWSSSNDAVLSVDQSGKITGVTVGGPVTITASAGGKSGTAQLSVTAVPVATVTVSPDSIVLGTGATFQLTAATLAANSAVLTGRTIAWSTALGATATVSGTGVVTGVAPGSTTITATSETKIGTTKVFVATPRLVYFWNDIPTPGGVQTPDPLYSFTLGTGASTINSSSTGVYQLGYTNFARAGAETEALFVTSYSNGAGSYCTIGGWSNEASSVYCWNAAGAATDLNFDFLALGSGTYPGRYAYAWVNDGSPTAPYAPSALFRYSSSNQPITVTKTATGAYSVLFAGQGRAVASDREAVMVSSYGGSNTHCQPGGWNSSGSDLTVTVNCFNFAGTASDNRFDIALISQPRVGATLGYLDADQPTNTTAYVPANSKVLPTGTGTVTRTGVGIYSVRFDGLIRSGSLKESFQISAVGNTPVRCRSGGWGFDATGVTTVVLCATPAGAATDSRFVIVGIQ